MVDISDYALRHHHKSIVQHLPVDQLRCLYVTYTTCICCQMYAQKTQNGTFSIFCVNKVYLVVHLESISSVVLCLTHSCILNLSVSISVCLLQFMSCRFYSSAKCLNYGTDIFSIFLYIFCLLMSKHAKYKYIGIG